MGVGKVLKNFVMQLFVQNLWNFASEQRSGMTFVLSSRTKKEVIVRPPRNSFNTNPYLASFLTGVLVREWHRKGIDGVTGILEASLAAQGDDLFWRVLRPTALLGAILCVIVGYPLMGLVLFLVGFNVFAQGERLIGYVRGLRRGKEALPDVINYMARTRKILLPLAGVMIGVLGASMIFGINSATLLTPSWFVFIPLFAISLVFASLRISPLFNLLLNLLVVVVLEIFI